MAKGVKKIKWVPRENDAKVFPTLSIANKLLAIEPDKFAWFDVDEWEDGTTQQDKRKDITWIRQDKSNYIIGQKTLPSDNFYGVRLTKKLCGPYTYYLEASSTGKPDATKNRGLKYRGHCPEKIVKCGWSKTKGNTDLTNQNDNNHGLAYGEAVYLHMETEGLNGAKLIVEVWNEMFKGDYKIREIYDAEVLDGEVNLKIPNTHLWRSDISMLQENEEFYVKVKTPSGRYITDGNKETEFDKYLNIKNKIVTPKFEVPSNQTPLKIGESGKNHERYEPCKFDAIQIKDTDAEKKPVTVTVFEGGKSPIINKGNPSSRINETIYFDFDKDTVEANSKQLLSNILQFLLEHPFSSMKLNGYACVIGKQDYNKGLSERRANTVKKFFADGKLDPSRITSIGHGEVNATDDKQGRDNIKYKDERGYINNRRVAIEFDYYGHVGQVVYETVAPSSGKNLTIEVMGHNTKKCFTKKDAHKKGIKVNATKYSKFNEINEASTISIEVESDLSAFNIAPLQYIWPKWNLVKGAIGNGLDSAVDYPVHIHSCRWFTDNKKPSMLIKAYPDIKWEFGLSFNWEHPFAYTHGNLPEYSRSNPKDPKVAEIIRENRKAQSKAVGAGKESKRVANSPEMLTKFQLKLEAKWGGQTFEISNELAEKIRAVLGVFIYYKEMADKVKESLKGAAKGIGSNPPYMFEVQAPALNANIGWYLEQVTTGKHAGKVATVGRLNFKADPLIGASFTIDLLASIKKMHPVVYAFVGATQELLAQANGTFMLEAKFSGELGFDFKALEFNSLLGVKGGTFDLGAKMKIEMVLILSASVREKSYTAEPLLELHLKGKFEAYFSGNLKFDCDEKGLFYIPEVGFSGMIFTFEIEIEIRGNKWVKRKFGNEDEPFLKPEPYKGEKHYLPFNNK